MSKKIFVTDMDCTALDDKKNMSPENLKAIDDAINAGHAFCIASGRALSALDRYVEECDIDRPGAYLIAYNGTIIYDLGQKKEIVHITLPRDDAMYIISEAKKYGLYVQTYQDELVMNEAATMEFELYSKHTGMQCKSDPNIWDMIRGDVPKVVLLGFDDEKREKLLKFRADHAEWEKGRCSSTFSCPEYLEYMPLGATKGEALVALSKILEVPIENTISVGDERNDISMIEAAGVGCAVCNGHEDVKKIADYVTENDNNHSALAEVIYKFM